MAIDSSPWPLPNRWWPSRTFVDTEDSSGKSAPPACAAVAQVAIRNKEEFKSYPLNFWSSRKPKRLAEIKMTKNEQKSPEKIKKIISAAQEKLSPEEIEKLILDAQEELKNPYKRVAFVDVLKKFQLLFSIGKGYNEAILVAFEVVQAERGDFKENALKLFQVLIENNQGHAKAIEAAEIGMKYPARGTFIEALKLYQVLVARGHAFNEAITAANNRTIMYAWPVVEELMSLFQMLLYKGKGIEEAEELIKFLNSRENQLRVVAFKKEFGEAYTLKMSELKKALKEAKERC